MVAKDSDADIGRVIHRNLSKFRKTGVYTVRPGYKFTGGWITNKRAIVATVDKKLDGLAPSQMLPAEVDDVPVDVREATGLQRLQAHDPAAHKLVVAHGREDYLEPPWKNEFNIRTGKKVVKKPVAERAADTKNKQQIDYKPPVGANLNPVTGKMTIVASASPDSGWDVLSAFFKDIKSRLTVGLYDFTSAHVLSALQAALSANNAQLDMVLDHPPRNQTADQTDDQTKKEIENALKGRAEIDWALTRNDPAVTRWAFPTAYHIKVAVRDGDTFWLSSGNWNNSNQPDLKGGQDARKGDRDWHLVISNASLAADFEAYIRNDLQTAKPWQSTGSEPLHAAIKKAMQKHTTESAKSTLSKKASPVKGSSFKPRIFADVELKADPLLTPDKGVYTGKVLALINSARSKLFMQTQYIHPSDKAGDGDFAALIEAMSKKHGAGVDVRIITSQYENTAQWIEKLKPYGLDKVLRIQDRVHNKGIVVDSQVVMVSSQNWSGDGVLRNRDAGIILYHAEIAKYFEDIFLDDWTNRASQHLVDASHTKTKKTGKKPVKKKPAKKTSKSKRS